MSSGGNTQEPIEVQQRIQEPKEQDEQRRRRALIGMQGRESTMLGGIENIMKQRLG